MATEQFKYQYKIISLGNSSVGKTSLIKRYVNQEFDERQLATVGLSNIIKDVCIGSDLISLNIWDTAGQEVYRSILTQYYRNSDALLLVYDITSRQSFNDLDHWLSEFKQYCYDEPLVILIGNKNDLEDRREVDVKTAKNYSKRHKMIFMETSCLMGVNVDKAFNTVAKMLLKKSRAYVDGSYQDAQIPTNTQKISVLTPINVGDATFVRDKRSCACQLDQKPVIFIQKPEDC